MMEILFIFGAIGWLMGVTWEYLSSLEAFPTLLVAFAGIPLIACAHYLDLLRRLDLEGLKRRRHPVPPERFYWTLHKSRLFRAFALSGLISAAAWTAAIRWPASLALTVPSVTGWFAGTVAIFGTAHFLASSVVYVRASQWFDKMSPWAVGICRRAMYRLSENPDFLGPGTPARKEREKTIY